jgi:hypothetical protein
MRKTAKEYISRAKLILSRAGLVVLGLIALLFLGIFAWALHRQNSNRTEPFPIVTSETEIVWSSRGHRWNLTGNPKMIHALRDLQRGHSIRGRTDRSISGVLWIDGREFDVDADMILSGYRAVVREEDGGWWEGRELAKLIFLHYSSPFPVVTPGTKIVLLCNGRQWDLTGNREMMDAIKDLRQGHKISGRAEKFVRGVLVIDGREFALLACKIPSGYRAVVRRKGGDMVTWWCGSELARMTFVRLALRDK